MQLAMRIRIALPVLMFSPHTVRKQKGPSPANTPETGLMRAAVPQKNRPAPFPETSPAMLR
jgi:hypothetical protein